MKTDDPQFRQQLIGLKDRIVAGFNESDWKELGVLLGQSDRIERHPRLLRSIRFGDDDYDGHVLTVLRNIIDDDPANLSAIVAFVQRKCPDTGDFISSEEGGQRRVVFTPNVFSVPNCSVNGNLVSVMIPFAGFDSVYETIRNACTGAGFECKRADDIWDHSTVIQDIFTLIFSAYIVVCDFTGKNPNVFYEAGIAHALGKHVIPITQSEDDVPFDLRHHRYIAYLNNTEGREDLERKLLERLTILSAKRRGLPWA